MQAENLVLTLRDLFQVVFEERKKKDSGSITVETTSQNNDAPRSLTLDNKKVGHLLHRLLHNFPLNQDHLIQYNSDESWFFGGIK